MFIKIHIIKFEVTVQTNIKYRKIMISTSQCPLPEIVNSHNKKTTMVFAIFNHQTAILESKFEGKISVNDLVECSLNIKANKSYPRFLKILIDSKKAIANFSSNELALLAEEHFKIVEKYDYVVTAIILETPKETAFAMLFQNLIKNNKSKFQLFATREAAIKWLNNYTESNCHRV